MMVRGSSDKWQGQRWTGHGGPFGGGEWVVRHREVDAARREVGKAGPGPARRVIDLVTRLAGVRPRARRRGPRSHERGHDLRSVALEGNPLRARGPVEEEVCCSPNQLVEYPTPTRIATITTTPTATYNPLRPRRRCTTGFGSVVAEGEGGDGGLVPALMGIPGRAGA